MIEKDTEFNTFKAILGEFFSKSIDPAVLARLKALQELETPDGMLKVHAKLSTMIRQCFTCGAENFRLLQNLSHIVLASEPSSGHPRPPSVPCAVMQCLSCGNTTIHDLSILGFIGSDVVLEPESVVSEPAGSQPAGSEPARKLSLVRPLPDDSPNGEGDK